MVLRNVLDTIQQQFTAGTPITKGQVVYISGDNQVSPASATTATKVIGIAAENALTKAGVSVILYGVAEVVADGAIAVGDTVVAARTIGRVVAENMGKVSITDLGHTHRENLAPRYIQNATSSSATTRISAIYEHGRIVGKALTAAAGTGSKLSILVYLK